MSFDARVLSVLIASPGDTRPARDVVEAAILSWNRDRARSQKVVLLPLRWEFDAVPELGSDAQAIINKQLVDEADIVIGLFNGRLGQPTPRGVSGSVEEIERSIERGARVHVFFSEMPLPRDVDPDQLKALREFQTDLQERGLLGSYASLEDLSAKVRTCLEQDVISLVPPLSVESRDQRETGKPRAILRSRYEVDREPDTDSRGRIRMRSRRNRLVVENLGTIAAEDVIVEIEAEGEGQPPQVLGKDAKAERIPPQGSIGFLLAVTMGSAPQWRVSYKWREGDQSFEDWQSVSIF
jgi:hypothetical protein